MKVLIALFASARNPASPEPVEPISVFEHPG
jgi:hypothetical protein